MPEDISDWYYKQDEKETKKRMNTPWGKEDDKMEKFLRESKQWNSTHADEKKWRKKLEGSK